MSGLMHLAGLEPKREPITLGRIGLGVLGKPDRPTSAVHGSSKSHKSISLPPDHQSPPTAFPRLPFHLRHQPTSSPFTSTPSSPSPPSPSDSLHVFPTNFY